MNNAAFGIDEKALRKKRALSSFRDGVILLAISMLLYFLNVTMIVFVSPLLIYSTLQSKKGASLLIAIESAVVVVAEILSNLPLLALGPVGWAIVALMLFFPLSLLAAGLVWLGTENMKGVPRVLTSLLPSLSFIAVYAIVFTADRALFNEVYAYIENAFAETIAPILSMVFNNLNIEAVFSVFLVTVASLVYPALISAVCATFFIYESARHSKEISYDEGVAQFELNPNYIWVFILSWALFLVSYFISAPIILEIIVINIAFSSLFMYTAEGFTVLYSWLKGKIPRLRSMTLFIIVFLVAMIIPGLNFIILLGLPILGLLENFFNLKKIGAKNENHS